MLIKGTLIELIIMCKNCDNSDGKYHKKIDIIYRKQIL